jgi:hypothetical protein
MPPSNPDLLTQAQAALERADTVQANPYTESPQYPALRALTLAVLGVGHELRQIRTELRRVAAAVEEATDA